MLDFERGSIPTDDAPATEMPEGSTSYDPEFPGSTPEAPYGYKPDGTPYKRRPNKSGSKRKTGSKGSESQARAAAGMLAQVNSLVGMSLMVFGMPGTAASIEEANARFETMALEALKTDSALCKKILSAGAASGKTALIMAYGYMGMSIAPAAWAEFKANRATEDVEDENVYNLAGS